jgi:hypothetical protein
MYWDKILWLLSWPAIIILSYYISVFLLKKFDKQIKNDPDL